MKDNEKIRSLLLKIYGREADESIAERLDLIIEKYRFKTPKPGAIRLSERDVILITYPDQVQEAGRPSLQSLADFCERYVQGLISGIHILPFYPWSSDDGFSVVDYCAVAPEYGSWDDIKRLGQNFRLMFDAVINHASARGPWFQGFLHDDPAYRDYFIQIAGEPDLSRVVRPRALPLLTSFATASGEKKVWTTFSPDQIDLNYHNPEVLLRVIDILLFYVSQGAQLIRLDAIAYLWKEVGTSCIHLPQTHAIVRLIRLILDEVAPHVMLITETNVPHAENISYFGNGVNEAQLVYNFSLPPLVLYAFHSGSAEVLSHWSSSLNLPSDRVTFFNFLASHDGIGLNPLRGILSEVEIEALAEEVKSHGGLVSYKSNPDGTQSPYELNVNYFDALSDPGESLDIQVDRFVTAHAILLSLIGLPGIYFHSLFGSRGWPEGVAEMGYNRAVNRQKLQLDEIERELADDSSMRANVFRRLSHLLEIRSTRSAFAPYSKQRVLESGRRVFGLLRQNAATKEIALCLHNLSPETQRVELNVSGLLLASSPVLHDLVGDQRFEVREKLKFTLRPYQFVWLVKEI